jgi:hypothetical protein
MVIGCFMMRSATAVSTESMLSNSRLTVPFVPVSALTHHRCRMAGLTSFAVLHLIGLPSVQRRIIAKLKIICHLIVFHPIECLCV